MDPAAIKREEDIIARTEELVDKIACLAKQGAEYVLPIFHKQKISAQNAYWRDQAQLRQLGVRRHAICQTAAQT